MSRQTYLQVPDKFLLGTQFVELFHLATLRFDRSLSMLQLDRESHRQRLSKACDAFQLVQIEQSLEDGDQAPRGVRPSAVIEAGKQPPLQAQHVVVAHQTTDQGIFQLDQIAQQALRLL